MKPRRTVASNHVLSLEGGNEDNDLWVSVGESDGTPLISSTWELTAEERERIAAGENVELVVFGTAHPPVLLRLTNVPIGGHINRAEVVDRLRGMGNTELAYLFENKTVAEIRAEVETWPLPDDLRGEMLAFVKLLEDQEEQPDLDRDVGGVAPELEEEAIACGLCGAAKSDPHEPCSSCGKLDRPPKTDEWPFDDDPPDPL